jgi:hypothetical protein
VTFAGNRYFLGVTVTLNPVNGFRVFGKWKLKVPNRYNQIWKVEDLGRLMERYELEGDRRFSNDVFEAGLDFESSVLFYWVWMPVAVLRERVRYRGQPDRGTTG